MKTKVYRTVSGDTWDLIAYKVYGNEKYFHRLIRNNLNLIDVSIKSGIMIGISAGNIEDRKSVV